MRHTSPCLDAFGPTGRAGRSGALRRRARARESPAQERTSLAVGPPFDSLYRHGFARVAVGIPAVRGADTVFNEGRTASLARRAAEARAVLTVFPELGLFSYTADDLFHQDALQVAVEASLAHLLDESARIPGVVVVGAPLRVGTGLFNCAIVMHRGEVLGVVPKSYLPSYREFYEKRYFAAARDALAHEVSVSSRRVPF